MDAFTHLSKEKQHKILNAALICYGKNGYEKTSIADIAVEAGISKASVFQYFGSKQALYLYLFQFSCDRILESMPIGTEDFFECIQLGAEAKLQVMAQYPGMYAFLSTAVTEETPAAYQLQQRLEAQAQAAPQLLAQVQWNRFKPGFDRTKVTQIIGWVNDGYVRANAGSKDADTMRWELWEYMELLKQVLYREEYQ